MLLVQEPKRGAADEGRTILPTSYLEDLKYIAVKFVLNCDLKTGLFNLIYDEVINFDLVAVILFCFILFARRVHISNNIINTDIKIKF